jgi:hypothetical protein
MCADTLTAMHTCLSLTHIGRLWYVEREVSGLLSALRGYCDAIHSCDISVEGPSGTGEARCWRVELRIRIFDEIVRAQVRAPEGSDPQQTLARVLADIYASARTQLTRIAEQHHGCCAHGGQATAGHVEACA